MAKHVFLLATQNYFKTKKTFHQTLNVKLEIVLHFAKISCFVTYCKNAKDTEQFNTIF